MSRPTTEEVREAVLILKEHLVLRNVSTREYFTGFEAVFELISSDWSTDVEIDPVWREGYEQCMTDMIDAVSDEWGVPVWYEQPGCLDPKE